MITWVNAYCELVGEKLSPSAVASTCALSIVKSTEPGSVGVTGRYKDEPMPFGSVTVDLAEGLELQASRIKALANAHSKLRELGLQEMDIQLSYGYEGQCNFEFSPEIFALLAQLNCGISISCFVD